MGSAPRVVWIGTFTDSAVVVVVRTFNWDVGTTKTECKINDISTPGEIGQQGETVSAKIMQFTALRNINAEVGLRAKGLFVSAELDTDSAVFIEDVVGFTVTTLVV